AGSTSNNFNVTAAGVRPAGSSTALSSSANPSAPGQLVTFTVTVAPNPPGGSSIPGGTVSFFDGAASIGQGTLNPGSGAATATFSTSSLTVGTHTLTASYNGDSNRSEKRRVGTEGQIVSSRQRAV